VKRIHQSNNFRKHLEFAFQIDLPPNKAFWEYERVLSVLREVEKEVKPKIQGSSLQADKHCGEGGSNK